MTNAEIGKVFMEFFRQVHGAGITHIMTGDFYIAYGRSVSAKTIEINFTADTPEEAVEGALKQWQEKTKTSNYRSEGG